MQSISTLVTPAAPLGAEPQPTPGREAVKNLFLLLQGAYGSLFLSKFATGRLDDQGSDMGVRAALAVWRSSLAKYPADVIETAAGRVLQSFEEFPPNLPQFQKLCDAAMPRLTYAEENNLPALPAPAPVVAAVVNVAKQSDGKDWARAILAREKAGDRFSLYSLKSARQALGMEGRMVWQ